MAKNEPWKEIPWLAYLAAKLFFFPETSKIFRSQTYKEAYFLINPAVHIAARPINSRTVTTPM